MPATGCSNRLQASYAKRGEAVNGGRLKPCNQQGKQGRMVRLADVARAAGVSTSTASRALSRPDMVAGGGPGGGAPPPPPGGVGGHAPPPGRAPPPPPHGGGRVTTPPHP
ncbi:LacI family DNA-binding transcriptional regulator, partial [Streptomyces sp. NPDC007875]|uniref:LacI family DNA-binding transcriptional regulator n=1 Tax=Streptomyces sp. NPDC007875 TaxID=3364783 RepID=UPI0036ACBF6A